MVQQMFVEIHCVHCGAYIPSEEQLRDLLTRGLIHGYQCYNCNEEVRVYVNGQRVNFPHELKQQVKAH